jgi:hypothetical protein
MRISLESASTVTQGRTSERAKAGRKRRPLSISGWAEDIGIASKALRETRGEPIFPGGSAARGVEEGAGFGEHVVGGDTVEAIEVAVRAAAEEARAAGNVFADDADGVSERAGEAGFGGAEDGDGWGAEESAEVHGAAVVAEDEAGVGEMADELVE